ncbi:hypothetical protein BDB00DRAFT_436893 [Zychaea mexicana]|uniref:uncharacterized protein n=1 Tax=Zychaea mexicana TaxID=64656 RepID=UPI0022FF03CE|nr:uncharacterized protein BDB00DRAFT_436893 [Zychaea mexicana]KAI9492365.1 hypothetical protein BDB00DRAFT_436893 [Zychaea mexicana]
MYKSLDIEQYIQEQLQSNAPVSLARFVADKRQFIVENTDIPEFQDIKGAWSSKFGNTAKRLKVTPSETRKSINWDSLSSAILKHFSQINASPDPVALDTSSKTSSKQNKSSPTLSTTSASKRDSFPLTPEARVEFEKKFRSMDPEMKWVLESGRAVEDVMFDLGSRLINEQ